MCEFVTCVVCENQADIVAQTRIVYHEKELLQLMHDHLLKEGMNDCFQLFTGYC